MIGMTLCSGIGAPEIADPSIDWRLASEIEPFPRAVLQERFGYRLPEDQNQGEPLLWSDMTEVTPELMRARGLPLPDLLVAGTPCQAFSIAGLRAGTADARGNLTLKFVETCHAIVDARPDGRLAVIWENVPGVLSDKNNAFGCFLGGLVGAMDALPQPADGSWPSEGMVQGPRSRAAWCVLDAQWFGVAQRRRRVFVVVDFGNCIDPAQILLEPESLRGNRPTRGEKRKDVAGTLSARTDGGGGLGTDFDLAGGLQAHGLSLRGRDGGATAELSGPVSTALRASTGGGDKPHVLVEPSTGDVDETRALDPASIAFAIQERAVSENPNNGPDGAGFRSDDCAYTLEARTNVQSVAFAQNSRDEVRIINEDGQITGARAAEPDMKQQTYIATPAVRRLMPVECARLQGFPDDHTAITYRGKPATDGPQYKAYGNSMAVPVMRWIIKRTKASYDQHRIGAR